MTTSWIDALHKIIREMPIEDLVRRSDIFEREIERRRDALSATAESARERMQTFEMTLERAREEARKRR